MTNLIFKKESKGYVSEFKVNGPFNIHLEKSKPGKIYFKQRGSDQGEYDIIKAADYSSRDLIIDDDYSSPVGLYPKWIKIESEVKPSVAVVSSNAEVEVLTQQEAENNTGSAVKEGDVLYYSCPSTVANTDPLKDLIKIKDNIVTVAAANAENPNTGSQTPIQSFINGENLEWTENATYGYVTVATSDYSSLDIIGFSFKVGSDLKTALDIVGTPIGGEITQITQEEYENIFNS